MNFKDKIRETLLDYSNRNLTDKAGGHAYEFLYPDILEKYEHIENLKLLEVGVWKGHSLRIWSDIFPNGEIYGSDIDYSIMEFDHTEYKNIRLGKEGSQDDPETFKDLPMFDIIIDDASHFIDLTQKTFHILKNYLKPGGIYVIEDINAWAHNTPYPQEFMDNFEIVDIRHIKNRADDIIFIYRN
jgi:SAM-dependent methyltransferase